MKGRRFTSFELSLINELAIIATLLVDRLSEPRDPEGHPEFPTLSALRVREIVDTAVRTAAVRKRLAHFRRLRGRRDGRPGAEELARLKLGGLDLDAPFTSTDLQS
jgi:hypothetical protein